MATRGLLFLNITSLPAAAAHKKHFSLPQDCFIPDLGKNLRTRDCVSIFYHQPIFFRPGIFDRAHCSDIFGLVILKKLNRFLLRLFDLVANGVRRQFLFRIVKNDY